MESLILDSLEIRRFRGFEHLVIERLGRVNLIVGKNNIGKTNLLTAIQLYANNASSPTFIWDILIAHNEVRRKLTNVKEMLTALRYLFYGRKEVRPGLEAIEIGSSTSREEALSIRVDWTVTEQLSDGTQHTRPLQPDETYTDDALSPRFSIIAAGTHLSYPIDPTLPQGIIRLNTKEIPAVYVTAHGLLIEQVSALWDNVALTKPEKDVLEALRLIAPRVIGLNFVGTPLSPVAEREPIVSILDVEEPLPLRSLGDGMQRVLEIALALVNAKNGLLLVDEFENGLHYSIQSSLWKLIFEIARRLNVQVFATTHSWDCVQGFQQAMQEMNSDDGMLVRLESKRGKIVSTLFDNRRLGIATREHIEVR